MAPEFWNLPQKPTEPNMAQFNNTRPHGRDASYGFMYIPEFRNIGLAVSI